MLESKLNKTKSNMSPYTVAETAETVAIQCADRVQDGLPACRLVRSGLPPLSGKILRTASLNLYFAFFQYWMPWLDCVYMNFSPQYVDRNM